MKRTDDYENVNIRIYVCVCVCACVKGSDGSVCPATHFENVYIMYIHLHVMCTCREKH